MRRRTALQAGTSGLLASLAGCTTLQAPTELHTPERTTESTETYWTFHADDERLTTVGIDYASALDTGRVPLEFHTWHREDTHLDAFRLELRFGRRAGGVPPDVYLDTFDSNPDPTIEFFDDPDRGATILYVPDLGPVGRGSLNISFLVDPAGWLPADLGVRIEQTLSVDRTLDPGYHTIVDDRIPFDIAGE